MRRTAAEAAAAEEAAAVQDAAILTPERQLEVIEFIEGDPVAQRFFLFFDALRMRGVERMQAARTAHLCTMEVRPSKDLLKSKPDESSD